MWPQGGQHSKRQRDRVTNLSQFPGTLLVLVLKSPFPGLTLRPGQTGMAGLPTERKPDKSPEYIALTLDPALFGATP